MNNDNDAAAFLPSLLFIKTLGNHFTGTKKTTTIKYSFVQAVRSNPVIREL